jgi:hypothetical protein
MRAMIHLDMKKLVPKSENLYTGSVYSLDFYPSTKNILVPMCDLEIGLIVLGEDLAICQWIKFFKTSFSSNFES